MSDSSYVIAALLDKMLNSDSDIRFMAMTDIGVELSKSSDHSQHQQPSMTEHVEKKVVAAILKALGDKNSEVQTLAVKTLAPLVKKVRETQMIEIIDHLGKILAEDREDLKDIATIGCKMVVMELNLTVSARIAHTAVSRILPIMANLMMKNNTVQIDIIDIVAECMARFGSMIIAEQSLLANQVQTQLLTLLNHSRPAVRKRTINAIGNLVVYASDTMFNTLVDHLLKSLRECSAARDYDKLRTYVACVGVLGRFSARRTGKHLDGFTKLLFEYFVFDDDELRENCFQTLESFVVRCPAEIATHLDKIIELCLEFVKHDPNYDYGDDDDDDEMQADEDVRMDQDGNVDDDENDEEDQEEDDDYSDADDVSWKVRRASAKLLASIINTRSERITDLFRRTASNLIARFKEREESVRVEILNTFVALVRQIGVTTGVLTSSQHSQSNQENWRSASNSALDSDTRILLTAQIPKLCISLSKQMNSKSVQTRLTGFQLLREVVVILHGGLSENLSLFVPAIMASLTGSSSLLPSSISSTAKVLNNPNLKLEVLLFLNVLFSMHDDAVAFQKHFDVLVRAVVIAAGETFYKITSEALLVLIELIKAVRPLPSTSTSVNIVVAGQLVAQIYQVVLSSARMIDVDIEVKERSLMALAVVLSQSSDLLPLEEVVNSALPLLADRIRNEVTRLTGLRALKTVTESPLFGLSTSRSSSAALVSGLNAVSDDVLQAGAGLLRKNARVVRLTALEMLESLLRRSAATPVLVLQKASVQMVLNEVVTVLQATEELDVHIFPLCMGVVTAALAQNDGVLDHVCEIILPVVTRTVLDLPHLVGKGVCLDVLLAFWSPLVASRPGVFVRAVDLLSAPFLTDGMVAISRQAYLPIAESIAAMANRVAPSTAVPTINKFVDVISKGVSKNSALLSLSLMILGGIGRTSDLSKAYPNLHENVVALFASPEEEIKHAAAYALGNISLGNLELYMPAVLAHVKEGGKKRFLVLIALKEIISRSTLSKSGVSLLSPFASELWELLFSNCQAAGMEEASRNMVSECLGKLLLMDPGSRLAALHVQLHSESAVVRATVVSALRYTITDIAAKDEFDDSVASNLIEFLRLGDTDLNVRHVSLVTLNSLARNRPYLIRGTIGRLLPLLYDETVEKSELITVVEMGPFKHRVDNGLEVRKSAYDCMYTLLETCLSRIEMSSFLDRVIVGLADSAQEIKLLNHLIMQRISSLVPTALLSRLDEVAVPLKVSVDAKPKANAVKQEIEKITDLVRSSVRTVAILSKVVSTAANEGMATAAAAPLFNELVKAVTTPGSPLHEVYVTVKNELDSQVQIGHVPMEF